MRVAEYPLSLLHWKIREDPWVRSIFLAAGVPLDELAERILDVASSEDSEAMMSRSLALWERLLGITPEDGATEEARRADVRAMWLASLPPSIETIQAVCDTMSPGQLEAEYMDGTVALWRTDAAQTRRDALMQRIESVKPAHITLTVGDRRYLGASGVSMEYCTGDITVSVPASQEG